MNTFPLSPKAWLAVVVLLAGGAVVDAQTNTGPWLSVGGGGGLADGSCDCQSSGRDATVGGSLAVGGGWTVTDRVRLGAEFALWAAPVDEARPLTAYRMYNLMSTVTYALRPAGGPFLRGGIGVGFVSGPARLYKYATLDRAKGLGGMIGVGYDVPINRHVAFTPSLRAWGAYIGDLRSGQDVLLSGWQQVVVDATFSLTFR